MDSDGVKIWLDYTGDVVISSLDPSMFDDGGSLNLAFLVPFHTIPGEDATIIVLTESEVEAGASIELDLGTDVVEIVFDGGLTVT